MLQEISAHTVDEAGKKMFVTSNAMTLLRKVRQQQQLLTRAEPLKQLSKQVPLCCLSKRTKSLDATRFLHASQSMPAVFARAFYHTVRLK